MNRLINARELAGVLGVKVSWVYQRTQHGPTAIPHVKLGKYVRFNVEEVIEFFKTGSGRGLEKVSRRGVS